MMISRWLLNGRRLAIVALAGGALLVAACGGEMNGSSSSGESDSNRTSAEPAAEQAANDASAEAPGGTDQSLPQAPLDRKIVRNATLELHVENVSAAVQQVDDVAGAAGGFVSSSNVFVTSGGDNSDSVERTQTASVTIRVPADAYSSVMSQLRGIAKETVAETSDASEVTEEYTDLQARLRNLEATEQRYLELLARAATIDEILTVQDRLSTVRLEIEQVTGRLNVLNNLTDFATITVRLSLPPAIAQGGDNQNWVEEAWSASWDTSKDACGARYRGDRRRGASRLDGGPGAGAICPVARVRKAHHGACAQAEPGVEPLPPNPSPGGVTCAEPVHTPPHPQIPSRDGGCTAHSCDRRSE